MKPGDQSKKEFLEQTIRVNHAGEYGAKRIYEGQLAVLGKKPVGKTIEHMKDQEIEHLQYFEKQLNERKIRPSILYPIWDVAGFALGAGTALLGEKAAMACTVAVEEVIDGHYEEQIKKIGDDESEKELKDKILKFQADELEHRQTGIDHDAEQAAGYPVLVNSIKLGSKAAIWLAKRF